MKIDIDLDLESTELFEQLDALAKTGLVSNAQIFQICQEYLSCPYPTAGDSENNLLSPTKIQGRRSIRAFFVEWADQNFSKKPKERINTFLKRFTQPLTTQFSVVWLLALGVFMLLASSATTVIRYRNTIDPLNQYLILFGYTLAAFISGLLVDRHRKLYLTARMLKLSSLFLIPLNFWMLDQTNILREGIIRYSILCAITIILSIIIIYWIGLYKVGHRFRNKNPVNTLLAINCLLLGWAEFLWSLLGEYQLTSVYALILLISSSLIIVFYKKNVRLDQQDSNETISSGIGVIGIVFFLLVLGIRALNTGIDWEQLTLYFGICGGLIYWLSQKTLQYKPWKLVGIGLFIFSWVLAIPAKMPLQALQGFALSILAVWLIYERFSYEKFNNGAVKTTTQVQCCISGIVINLHSFWWLWRAIPNPIRHETVNRLSEVFSAADTSFLPLPFIGLILLPYMLFKQGLAHNFYKAKKRSLTKILDVSSLSLGLFILVTGFQDPLIRGLNLLLLSIILLWFIRQRDSQSSLPIYLTNFSVSLLLGTVLITLYPIDSPSKYWAGLAIILAILEWGLSLLRLPITWRKSSWYFGIGLASVGYVLLGHVSVVQETTSLTSLRWLWLIVPICLTCMGYAKRHVDTHLAINLSTVALVLTQLLNINHTKSLTISLGVMAILMLLNTHQLRQTITTFLTVGVWIFFSIAAYSLGNPLQLNWESFNLYINILGVITLLLWVLYGFLSRSNNKLTSLYQEAIDAWAVALVVPLALTLIIYNFSLYASNFKDPNSWQMILLASVLTIATSYRSWTKPNALVFCMLGLNLEVLISSVLGNFYPTNISLLIAISLCIGLGIYFIPWSKLQAPTRLFQKASLTIPGTAILITASNIQVPSLLMTAAFYAWIAQSERRLRLSYISVGLLSWSIARAMTDIGLFGVSLWSDLTWYSFLAGFVVLYITQFDPLLAKPEQRSKRHILRILALSLVSISLLIHSSDMFWIGLMTIGFSIIMIVIGLRLQVRAFLYIGTATFIFQVLHQLWAFNSSHPFLISIIGIGLALLFFWISAKFESERGQLGSIVDEMANLFEDWE